MFSHVESLLGNDFDRHADDGYHYGSLPCLSPWLSCNNLTYSRFTWCSADLTPRLTWEHWIYGNYNAFPCPAEFLWNTRQRLHVNVAATSFSNTLQVPLMPTLSYIRNDYFLCKSMNEIRAAGTYTCHVPLFRSIQGARIWRNQFLRQRSSHSIML